MRNGVVLGLNDPEASHKQVRVHNWSVRNGVVSTSEVKNDGLIRCCDSGCHYSLASSLDFLIKGINRYHLVVVGEYFARSVCNDGK